MFLRNNVLKTDTLLLSATPSLLHKIWETIDNKTTVLPNENEHYNAQHNEMYSLEILDYEPNILNGVKNTFVKYNTIKNAQKYKKLSDFHYLIHSGFEETKKNQHIKTLFEEFGKDSISNNKNVVGTHILQSSLDITFQNLVESILSPESTIQTIGRINRFGDYMHRWVEQPTIKLFKADSKTNRSEISICKELYCNDLSTQWFNFLHKKFNNVEDVNLNKLYEIYNEFNLVFQKEISKFVKVKYNNSLKHLINIYPHKFNKSKKMKNDVKTAGSNKFRTTNSEIFYICEKFGTNGTEFAGPFTYSIRNDGNIGNEFDEDGNIFNKLIKTMKKINDERFNYDDILTLNKYGNGRLNLDVLREMGKRSNTPYIRFDVVYHDELGVIKKEDLSNILQNN